jgi:hypothetical protein
LRALTSARPIGTRQFPTFLPLWERTDLSRESERIASRLRHTPTSGSLHREHGDGGNVRVLILSLLMAAGISACGATYPDCIGALRYGDQTYHEIGFTDHEGTMLRQSARFASCDTVRGDGSAEALAKDGEAVKVRTLPGYGAEQVVVVRVTDSAWSVLVSDAAPAELAQQIRDAGLLNAGQQ